MFLHCSNKRWNCRRKINVSNLAEILLRMSAQNLRSVRRQSCVGCRILESYSTLYMRYQVLESWTKYVRDFAQRFYCIVSGFLDPVISSSSPRLIVGCSVYLWTLFFFFFTHHAADSLSSLGCRARSLKQIKIVGSFAVRFSSSENIFMRIQCAFFYITNINATDKPTLLAFCVLEKNLNNFSNDKRESRGDTSTPANCSKKKMKANIALFLQPLESRLEWEKNWK